MANNGNRATLTPEEMAELSLSGWRASHIAEFAGVTTPAVLYHLHRLEVPVQGRGRPRNDESDTLAA
jgi:hypothetical protein